MSPFRRTLRLLNEDWLTRWAWMFALVATLLAAWTAWFVFARVAVYETSRSARVEIEGNAYALDAPVTGRVLVSHLALGRRVRAGEVLIEIDPGSLLTDRRELDVKRGAITNEIAALERELTAAGAATAAETSSAKLVSEEAAAKWQEARAAALLASEESLRAVRMHAAGLIAAADLQRVQAVSEQRSAAANALRVAVERFQSDGVLRQKERAEKCAELERTLAALTGQRAALAEAISRVDDGLDRCRFRAAADGVLGDVTPLRAGAVVGQGDRLATVVSRDTLHVIAFFASDAVGRLRKGQEGQLRLAAYPWQQYGTVPVKVEHVATELRDSQVRVELSVLAGRSDIPLQHALAGSVEVQLERISPALLVLRSAGRRLKAPA